MHHRMTKSDAILALGSMDSRVATRAAELWHQSMAEIIVVSGGFGRLTGKSQSKSEADVFREVLLKNGIPDSAIIVEDKSTNTGANLQFSIQKLVELGTKVEQVIIVTKPYAEKRTYATMQKLFPNITSLHTSPQLNYDDYPEGEITKDLAINIMVGEVERIRQYPKLGYTVPLDVPQEIEQAMKYLIGAGFDRQLLG